MKSKTQIMSLYITPIVCLAILFHNGFEVLIPEIAIPIILILNLSVLASFYIFYKRRKKFQDLVAVNFIFLVPFIMFLIGLMLPVFYLPTESYQDKNKMTFYYNQTSYGPKLFVYKYVAEGIYLKHIDTLTCRGNSIQDCINPKI